MELEVFLGYYVVVGIVLELLSVAYDGNSRDTRVTTTSKFLQEFVQITVLWSAILFLMVLFSCCDHVRSWKWN